MLELSCSEAGWPNHAPLLRDPLRCCTVALLGKTVDTFGVGMSHRLEPRQDAFGPPSASLMSSGMRGRDLSRRHFAVKQKLPARHGANPSSSCLWTPVVTAAQAPPRGRCEFRWVSAPRWWPSFHRLAERRRPALRWSKERRAAKLGFRRARCRVSCATKWRPHSRATT
jgi:hypothetical protein